MLDLIIPFGIGLILIALVGSFLDIEERNRKNKVILVWIINSIILFISWIIWQNMFLENVCDNKYKSEIINNKSYITTLKKDKCFLIDTQNNKIVNNFIIK